MKMPKLIAMKTGTCCHRLKSGSGSGSGSRSCCSGTVSAFSKGKAFSLFCVLAGMAEARSIVGSTVSMTVGTWKVEELGENKKTALVVTDGKTPTPRPAQVLAPPMYYLYNQVKPTNH